MSFMRGIYLLNISTDILDNSGNFSCVGKVVQWFLCSGSFGGYPIYKTDMVYFGVFRANFFRQSPFWTFVTMSRNPTNVIIMFRKTGGKGTPFENWCFDRKKQGGFYQSIITAVFKNETT